MAAKLVQKTAFYKASIKHKLGYKNDFGVTSFMVDGRWDESVHLNVSSHDEHSVLVTSFTELGELFLEEIEGVSMRCHTVSFLSEKEIESFLTAV